MRCMHQGEKKITLGSGVGNELKSPQLNITIKI